MTQCDLIVAPQVSEEWTSSTRVWWMQMDWDTDRSNTSSNENFQQRVSSVWTTRGVGSATREHPAMMMEIGTYDRYPINNAAECHTDMMTRSKINRPNERTIWDYPSSMKQERKLRINQREGEELSRWTVKLKRERKFYFLRDNSRPPF